jgi:uncharacterized membrane protein
MADSFFSKLREDPATKELMSSLGGFAAAQAGNLASNAIGKIGGGGKSDDDDDGASKSDQVKGGAMEGAGEAMGEGKSKIFGGIKGALKGLFKTGGSAKRPTNIYEQIFVGVPVEQAYANWTEYSKFPEFMKGPESVKVDKEEDEETGEVKETHQWTAKIFLNRRSWKATVEEDVENSRIRWSTEAPKGTIDGAITFTPIGDNATLIIYTLEYRPKGFFEWWGNRWRTVGRRARLDVKHFGRYVMMQDQTQDEESDTEEEPDELEEQGTGDAEQPEEEAAEDADQVEDEPDEVDEVDAEDEGGDGDDEGEEGGEEDEPVSRRTPRQERKPRQGRS